MDHIIKIPMKSLVTTCLLILTVLSTSPVNAELQNVLNEEFSSSSNDWLFYAAGNNDAYPDQNSTWEIEDGALTSGGDYIDYSRYNHACVQTKTSEGTWSFRIYGVNDRYKAGFRISTPPQLNYEGEGDFSYPFYPFIGGWMPAMAMYIEHMQTSSGENVTYNLTGVSQIYTNSTYYSGWQENFVHRSVSNESISGWHSYSINKKERKVEMYKDGELFDVGEIVDSVNVEYNSICLYAQIGTGVKFDDISVSKFIDKDNTMLLFAVGIVSFIAILRGSQIYYKSRKVKKLTELKKINLDIIKKANYEFEISDKSIFQLTFGATHIKDEPTREKFKEILPQELLTYRYLLHPARLTIMKMLNVEEKMRSSDIKHILDIAWGEYSNHIKSLEQKGYVEVLNEFNEEGNVMQIAYITEFGRKQYGLVFTLLQQFVAKSSPYDYLLYAQANLKDQQMYPETGFE